MGQTLLVGTDYYGDMICSGKKLFLLHGFLPKNVTKYVREIEMFNGGSRVPLGKVVRNSCIGAALVGPVGGMLGALATSPQQLHVFRVFFHPGLKASVIDVHTTDKYLDQWLASRAIRSVENGTEHDFI